MANICMCGFEWGLVTEAGFGVSKSGSVIGNTARSGAHGVKLKYQYSNTEWESTLSRGVPAAAEYYLQYGFHPETLGAVGAKQVFKWQRSGSVVGGIKLDTNTGRLDVYTGNFATLVGSSIAMVSAAAWNLIELRLKLDTANGVIALRLNGVDQFTFTGNTGAVATLLDQFVWSAGFAYGDLWWWYDDIIINDTSGSKNNSWPNGLKVILIRPVSDAGPNAWSPSAGSDHYALVDERPPTSADYLRAESNNLVEAFGLESLPEDALAIHQVRLDTWCQRGSSEEPSHIQLGVKLAGTDYYSGDLTPPFMPNITSYALAENPAGGVWSKEDINGMNLLIKATA